MTTSARIPHATHPSLAGLRLAVTGGTSGLGLAVVEAALARGARVAFVARTRDRVEQVARTVRGARGVVGDVSRKDDVYPIALQLAAALGGLDVLVNNASSLGPVPLAPLADTACEDLEAALATNLLGPFRLTKAVLGSLTAAARDGRGGLVVNVSSDAAVSAYEGWGAYGASKAALLHLTRIWHQEVAPLGVEMISFDPGDMDTPLHAAALPDADRSLLKRPAVAADELCELIAAHVARRSTGEPVQP